MAHPPHRPIDRGSRIQLVAVLLVVLVVAVVGILVVAYPRQLGLPGLRASTPVVIEGTPGTQGDREAWPRGTDPVGRTFARSG